VSLQRQLGVLSTKKPQREIETRLDRRVGSLQRSPERVYSALGVVLVPTQNAKVVLSEGIAGVDLQRACIALLRFGVTSLQLQRDAPPVPRFCRRRELAREAVCRGDRCARVTLQQIELEHRLQHFSVRFPAL